MATIQEIRKQYPQYDDLSDADLAKALHGRFYSDMPFDEFSKRIGVQAESSPQQTPVAGTGDFAEFEARFKRGEIRPVNAGTTLADIGEQFRGGLVQGAAGMAQLPETAGAWFADKATQGIGALMGREHQPAPQMDTGIPSPGQVGGRIVDAMELGAPKTTAGGYANTIGQFIPSTLAGGPANMADKTIRAITAGVGSEAAGNATAGQWWEPYARMAGGLLGGLAPDVARRVVTPFPVSAERQRLLGVMDSEGIPLTAGQRTGRQGLKYAEAELGGGRLGQMIDQQSEAFTAATLRRAGINANRATPEVMDEAFTRIGNQFDDLASRTSVPLDRKLQDDLLNAVTEYQSVAGDMRPAAEQIMNRISELAGQNKGVLSGSAYKDISSRISKLMGSRGADAALKEAVGNIRAALDDAVERNLSGDLLTSWREARTAYRNLKTIEAAAVASGDKVAEGLIAPSQLRNATVQKQGSTNYARGRGDFADLARAGEATMKPLPQSGTAPRLMVRSAGATLPVLLGSILGRATGVPGGEIMGGLLGLSAPFVQGKVLMSRPVQRYLANQRAGAVRMPYGQRVAVPLLGSGYGVSNP